MPFFKANPIEQLCAERNSNPTGMVLDCYLGISITSHVCCSSDASLDIRSHSTVCLSSNTYEPERHKPLTTSLFSNLRKNARRIMIVHLELFFNSPWQPRHPWPSFVARLGVPQIASQHAASFLRNERRNSPCTNFPTCPRSWNGTN
jgi:hypothetical protein